jgi:hypothetical protein
VNFPGNTKNYTLVFGCHHLTHHTLSSTPEDKLASTVVENMKETIKKAKHRRSDEARAAVNLITANQFFFILTPAFLAFSFQGFPLLDNQFGFSLFCSFCLFSFFISCAFLRFGFSLFPFP